MPSWNCFRQVTILLPQMIYMEVHTGFYPTFHSGTKYLGGHNDTLAGFLVVAEPVIAECLRFIYKTIGACLSPFDSWLLIRGIKTLAVRLEQQQLSAGKFAHWLCTHKKVKTVHYTGLAEHPGHWLFKRQGSGFGAMLSFEVDCQETANSHCCTWGSNSDI